jgi:hypothetical protein
VEVVYFALVEVHHNLRELALDLVVEEGRHIDLSQVEVVHRNLHAGAGRSQVEVVLRNHQMEVVQIQVEVAA